MKNRTGPTLQICMSLSFTLSPNTHCCADSWSLDPQWISLSANKIYSPMNPTTSNVTANTLEHRTDVSRVTQQVWSNIAMPWCSKDNGRSACHSSKSDLPVYLLLLPRLLHGLAGHPAVEESTTVITPQALNHR